MKRERVLYIVYAACYLAVASMAAVVYEYSTAAVVLLVVGGVVYTRGGWYRSSGAVVPGLMLVLPLGGPSIAFRILGIAGVVCLFEMEAALHRFGPGNRWHGAVHGVAAMGVVSAATAIAYLIFQTGIRVPAWSAAVSLVPVSVLFAWLHTEPTDRE